MNPLLLFIENHGRKQLVVYCERVIASYSLGGVFVLGEETGGILVLSMDGREGQFSLNLLSRSSLEPIWKISARLPQDLFPMSATAGPLGCVAKLTNDSYAFVCGSFDGAKLPLFSIAVVSKATGAVTLTALPKTASVPMLSVADGNAYLHLRFGAAAAALNLLPDGECQFHDAVFASAPGWPDDSEKVSRTVEFSGNVGPYLLEVQPGTRTARVVFTKQSGEKEISLREIPSSVSGIRVERTEEDYGILMLSLGNKLSTGCHLYLYDRAGNLASTQYVEVIGRPTVCSANLMAWAADEKRARYVEVDGAPKKLQVRDFVYPEVDGSALVFLVRIQPPETAR